MSKRLVWQGSHDNLCGIYCASHVISCRKTTVADNHEIYEECIKAAFFGLIKSSEDLGLLTAKRLAGTKDGGFLSPELAHIFNNLKPQARAGLEAVAFDSAVFKQYAAAISPKDSFRGPTFAIIKEKGDSHWIAVDGIHRDGGYHCYDPNREENVTHRQRIQWDDGLMIAPRGWLTR